MDDFLKTVKGDPDYFDNIKGEADTLAGLIIEIAGKIPRIGYKNTYPPYIFQIEASDSRRIKRVKVIING